MRNRFVPHLAWLAVIGFCLAGCHSDPDKLDRPENPFKNQDNGPGGKKPLSDRELRAKADELYRHARTALDSSDYSTAITRYDQLIARYPFSDYSTQAELEKIYAQYKSLQADDAVTAADRFLRAHPRHPYADYVQYVKGLTDFERDSGVLTYLNYESSKRDVGNQLRAFEDFSLLLQKYPKSRYAGDARRRMLYARNRIAEHELSVAQFYVSRGAYVAAAKRAGDIVMQYPGAPATIEALKVLQESDAKLGLAQQAKDAGTLIEANTGKLEYTDPPPVRTLTLAAEDPVPAIPPTPAPAEPAAAAPAPAPAQQPQPAAQQPAQPTHKGFFSWFTGLFSFLDSSKPENQHVYVIGSSSAPATAAAPATATASAAPAATPAEGSANASAAPTGSGSGFHVYGHVPGDDSEPPAAAASPSTATQASTSAAATSSSP